MFSRPLLQSQLDVLYAGYGVDGVPSMQPFTPPITPMTPRTPGHCSEYHNVRLIPRLKRYVNLDINPEGPPMEDEFHGDHPAFYGDFGVDFNGDINGEFNYDFHGDFGGMPYGPPPHFIPSLTDTPSQMSLSMDVDGACPPPDLVVDPAAMPMPPAQPPPLSVMGAMPSMTGMGVFPVMMPMSSNPHDLQRQLSDMKATVQEELNALDSLFPGFKPDLSQSADACNAHNCPLPQQAAPKENVILHAD